MRKNKPNKNYQSKNHSKFILTYHIIFTCKYRKKLLIKYGEDIKQIMFDISKNMTLKLKKWKQIKSGKQKILHQNNFLILTNKILSSPAIVSKVNFSLRLINLDKHVGQRHHSMQRLLISVQYQTLQQSVMGSQSYKPL